MCMISKLMEKCSSSTVKVVGSARATGEVTSSIAAVVDLMKSVCMMQSPYKEPAHIQIERPCQQQQSNSKGKAGEARGNRGNDRNHQCDHLPHAHGFAPEAGGQWLIQPGKV